MRRLNFLLAVGLLVSTGINKSLADPTTEFLHQKATELANEDKTEEAVKILRSILDRDPQNYPVYIDYVVYTAWTGRCDDALRLYAPIQSHSGQTAELITAIADCKAEHNLPQAIAFLEKWQNEYPDEDEIKDALADKRGTYALRMSPVLDVEFSVNNSDVPAQVGEQKEKPVETVANLRYTQPIWHNLSTYARYLQINSSDKKIPSENMQRVGAGVNWDITEKFALTQDYSESLRKRRELGPDSGGLTRVTYLPHPLWELNAEYASYAEDVPLRALAQHTTTDRVSGSWYFHTTDYRLEWLASVASYRFKTRGDLSNKRLSGSTEFSYAFETGKREQRLGLEVAANDNAFTTLADAQAATYYSPDKDLDVALVYKLHYNYQSKFTKHIDHVSVYYGLYHLDSYVPDTGSPVTCTDPQYGLAYEQEYAFGKKTSLRLGGGYGSRVYDCTREDQFEAHIAVSRILWQ